MREVKFRVYNKDTGKIMQWEDIKRFGNLNKLLTLNHQTVVQYTGLKDKNGKEIYEGDIILLKADSYSKELGKADKEWFVVAEWNAKKACFQLTYTEQDGDKLIWKFDTTDFNGKPFIKEVIGNIYENPELLK